jgi:hypothetical protein
VAGNGGGVPRTLVADKCLVVRRDMVGSKGMCRSPTLSHVFGTFPLGDWNEETARAGPFERVKVQVRSGP